MIIEKIERSLSLLFLLLLILAQSLVWVASRAASHPGYDLQANYIEPIVGQAIVQGEEPYFQAQLTANGQTEFSAVFFTLSNYSSGQEINFEASPQTDGSYLSAASWSTAQYDLGEYYLFTTAQNFSDAGELLNSYQSRPQTIILSAGLIQAEANSFNTPFLIPITFQMPSEGQTVTVSNLDIAGNLNVSAEWDQADATDYDNYFNIYDVYFSLTQGANVILEADASSGGAGYSGVMDFSELPSGNYTINLMMSTASAADYISVARVNFVWQSTVTDDLDLSAIEIVLPSPGQVVQDNLSLSLQTPVSVDLSSHSLPVDIIDNDDNLVTRVFLQVNNNLAAIFQYQQEVNVSDYENGTYIAKFYYAANTVNAGTVQEVGSVEFTISHIVEDNQYIELHSPVPGSTVNSPSFDLQLVTGFPSSNLSITLFKTDDPAISLDKPIPPSDGYSWSTNLVLDDSFIDGEYTLVARGAATVVSAGVTQTIPVEQEFTLYLQLAELEPELLPEDIIIRLHNTDTTLTGNVYLLASSNYLVQGNLATSLINWQFLATDSDSSWSASTRNHSPWSSLQSYGVSQANNADTPYAYLATYNTRQLPNGNYYLSAWTGSPAIESARLLVTIFNEENAAGNLVDQEDIDAEEELVDQIVPTEEPVEETAEEPTEGTGGQANVTVRPGANVGGVAIGLHITCLQAGISNPASCDRFMATLARLDSQCIDQQIYEAMACEDYLNRTQVDRECQEQDIVDREQCKDYLLEKYGGSVECRLNNTAACGQLLREQYLNRLVVGQRKQQSIDETVNSLIGQVITVGELNEQLSARGLTEDIVPLEAPETKILMARSHKETILEDEENLTIIGQAVMVIDSDSDGLSDDLEEYYGTDINNPDTDGDGYSDGTEVANNYSPLGIGPLAKTRTVMDQIMLAQATIEQPKNKSSKIDQAFAVKEVAGLEDGQVKLSGQAEPNSWVTLYLYSDLPLVLTTKTDASGNWSYDIKQSLTDGSHRVYVTVNDSTGKIVKQSSPISFLIRSAQAVTANDYFDDTTSQDSVNNMLIYYILGAAFLIVLALGIIIFLHKDKRQELEL